VLLVTTLKSTIMLLGFILPLFFLIFAV